LFKELLTGKTAVRNMGDNSRGAHDEPLSLSPRHKDMQSAAYSNNATTVTMTSAQSTPVLLPKKSAVISSVNLDSINQIVNINGATNSEMNETQENVFEERPLIPRTEVKSRTTITSGTGNDVEKEKTFEVGTYTELSNDKSEKRVFESRDCLPRTVGTGKLTDNTSGNDVKKSLLATVIVERPKNQESTSPVENIQHDDQRINVVSNNKDDSHTSSNLSLSPNEVSLNGGLAFDGKDLGGNFTDTANLLEVAVSLEYPETTVSTPEKDKRSSSTFLGSCQWF
jgi:hypothetical protein